MKVVIVGAGWAGCAAAIESSKQGADVTLIERTDMILGTGLVGGIMRNNGRFTATEELIAMGGGELFEIISKNLTHHNISFPGHEHADLYDISKTPMAVLECLKKHLITLVLETRITKVTMDNKRILNVIDEKGMVYDADVFIDATGTAGPMNNCIKYGNGCGMCVLRCPSFGGRVSLAGLAGVTEIIGEKADGSKGAMSGSCKLMKESLSSEIVDMLNENGVAIIPLPPNLIEDHLSKKACQQYALQEFKNNIILLDTGHAKLMTPYFPLEKLHQVPGFENARYEDPYSGGKANSMRFFAMCHRDNTLKVEGVENLYCAGEKAGLLVGHTEAIITGTLAGYNAVKFANKEVTLTIPRELSIGEAISYVQEQMQTKEGSHKKYTFSGSVLFNRLKEKELYSINITDIKNRVEKYSLLNVF